MKKFTKANQTKSEAILKGIGVFAVVAFVTASAAYIYSPVSETNAAYKSQKNIKVKIDVDPTISITMSTQRVDLTGPVNTFAQDSMDVDVTTNSKYGYSLTIEDKDDNTNLVHRNSNISDVVTSNFEGGKTSANMANNTWGYSTNSTDFYKVPVRGSATTIKTTDHVIDADYDRTPVDFGVKIGPTLTSGHYEDVVIFTAFVNGQDEDPSGGNNP